MAKNTLNKLRKYRASTEPLRRGVVQRETLGSSKKQLFFWEIVVFSIVSICAFGILVYEFPIYAPLSNLSTVWGYMSTSLMYGFFAAIVFLIFPLVGLILHSLFTFRLPAYQQFKKFSPMQMAISTLICAVILAMLVDYWDAPAFSVLLHAIEKCGFAGLKSIPWMLNKPHWHNKFIRFVIVVIFNWVGLIFLFQRYWPRDRVKIRIPFTKSIKTVLTPPDEKKAEHKNKPFRLWLGTSTGILNRRNHPAGIKAKQNVTLSLNDAVQNILILGGTGAGKTSKIINPLLIQLFDQDCGGLIFDVKNNFKKGVEQFSRETGRKLTIIGPEHTQINLIDGLSPEMAASFLSSAFSLSARGQEANTFWIDTAYDLCKNVLGILSFLPERYSLENLYLYLFIDEVSSEIDGEIFSVEKDLDEDQKRLLNMYRRYNTSVFKQFPDDTQKSVKATVSKVLSPFNHPELVDAFCLADKGMVNLQDVINGEVFLVNLPLSQHGLGSKIAYNFIKLRFFNIMKSRHDHHDWNQTRPIFFMCDEYQELISANQNGLSDFDFWAVSRSSNTIGIISSQAMSTFYATIGDKVLADSILQNFRQTLCYKVEDQITLQYFEHLLGRVEVAKRSYSKTKGESSHSGNGSSSSSTSSNVESLSFIEKSVADAQLFRNFTPNQALAVLNINNWSMDDVIETEYHGVDNV